MEAFVESDFEELKNQVNSKKEGTIIGNIKNINYEINLSKPIRVILKDINNEIEIYSGKIAKSEIEIDREEKRVHYRKKNALNVGVTLVRIVSIIQSEINNRKYLSEKYLLKEQFDDNMISKKANKIIEDLLINNDKLKGNNEGEFIRELIQTNDDLVNLIHPEEELDKYLIEGSKTKLGNFPSGFYEDRHDYEFNKKNKNKIEKNYEYYIKLGEDELNKYKDLYLTIEKIVKGEKGIEDNDKEEITKEEVKEVEETEKIENDILENKQDIIENEISETEEIENNEENLDDEDDFFNEKVDEVVFALKERKKASEKNITIEKQEKVEESKENKNEEEAEQEDSKIDEVFIDSIVNGLKEKRREEQKNQIRTDKINKVKELISLNKELDKEIEIIEKGNLEEGEN